MFRFSVHTFDTDTGELGGPRESLRLQPKPARLLAMVLEAGGELVEREQIRATLWPDTTVDFDAGLNTCMRQIRTALRESGGEVECIETLPKRGYRITVAVQGNAQQAVRGDARQAVPGGAAVSPSTAQPGRAAAVPYVVTFILLTIGTGVVLWAALVGDPGSLSEADTAPRGDVVGDTSNGTPSAEGTVAAPMRLAVVPFVDPASDANATFNRDLTEAFVAALVNAAPDDIVVIGPSTTAQHFTEGSSLPDVAAAVNADFVLHGGHRSSADIFFVEVVLADGAHLYAQRMDLDLGAPARAPPEVITAMLKALGR